MGTNFYVEWPGVVEGGGFTPARRLHVCKSAKTWAGYRDTWRAEGAGQPVLSVRDWWTYLEKALAAGAVLHDEYGTVRTIEYLREWADGLPKPTRRSTFDWVQEHRDRVLSGYDRYWVDADGFTLYDGEFS